MAAAPKVDLTPELQEQVLDRLASGESLREICRSEGMPEISQVMRLRRSDEAFATQYAHAREMQAETFGEELKDIADDGSNDWMEKQFGNQKAWVLNGEAVARSRLRFDQRRWWMSKVLPKQFGDKIQTEHSGSVGVSLVNDIPRPARD